MKFVSYGLLLLEPDADGNPTLVVHPGDEVPASLEQASIDWLVANDFVFDPMPDQPEPQAPASPTPA